MVTVFCLECEQAINLESRPEEGEVLLCSSCGAELEVINLEPTELDWAYLNPITIEDSARQRRMARL
jgi:alpha-aminoadipate carrier protein LysW